MMLKNNAVFCRLYYIGVLLAALVCCQKGYSGALDDLSPLFEKEKYSSASFSPNGKYLLQVQDNARNYSLVITDLDKSEVIYEPVVGRWYPKNISWIGDRRVIYEQGGRLVAMNIDGREHRVIFNNIDLKKNTYYTTGRFRRQHRRWSVEHTLPEEPEYIITQTRNKKGYASLQKTNIFTSEHKKIVNGMKNKITSWIVDKSGNAVAGVKSRKNKKEILYIDKKDHMGENDDTFEVLSKSSTSGGIYLKTEMFLVSGSYQEDVVYVSEATKSDRYQLSAYNVREGRLLDTVMVDLKYDIGGPDSQPELRFDRQNKKLVGVSYYRSHLVTRWVDPRFKIFQQDLDKNFPKTINTIEDWTDDLSKLLVRSTSATSIGRSYVYYPKKGKIVLQGEAIELDALDVPEPKVVRYKSQDGTEHESYLLQPKEAAIDQKFPAIVMVHGGPWSRYVNSFDANAAYFALNGYIVLRVNFRGSTGFGKKYLSKGIKSLSEIMVDDIATGARWLKKRSDVDVERVFIMGASYGGYAALMSGLRYSKVFKGVSSFAAPLDLAYQIRHYKEIDNHFGYEFWSTAVGDLSRDRKLLKATSPLHRIEDMSVPYIIFHGDKDKVVPVKHALMYKKKLKAAKKSNVVSIMRDVGHGFSHSSSRLYYLNKVRRFFDSL
ncbi:MAG: prolyl oligopeptidase family serine peptidase [Agarilytica sp.]